MVNTYSDRAFSIDALLTAAECEQLIQLAQTEGFAAAGIRTMAGHKSMPQIRNNDRAMLELPEWVAILWERLRAVALPELDGCVATALPKDLRFYKYSPGQRFKMHKDGPWNEAGLTSKLTLLVYLNQGFIGGDTDFRDFRVVPETGRGLLFIHDTWHEGEAVQEGVKYVLRSDILYAPKA